MVNKKAFKKDAHSTALGILGAIFGDYVDSGDPDGFIVHASGALADAWDIEHIDAEEAILSEIGKILK